MIFNLATMAKRAENRRRMVTLAPIQTSSAQAQALARIYRQMLAPWLNAQQRILDRYENELRLRATVRDSADDLEQFFSTLSDEVDRLVLELRPAMQRFSIEIERWHRRKWAQSILNGLELDISTMIGPEDAQEAISDFMARNTALVRDVSNQARGRISDAVFRGLQREAPTRDIGRAISQALGMGRRRANFIARDQAAKLGAALDAERQRQAGLTVWKWRHSGKLHFRPEHKARDGNLYADLASDRGTAPTGETIAEPPKDLPGELPYCGCNRQGVLILGD